MKRTLILLLVSFCFFGQLFAQKKADIPKSVSAWLSKELKSKPKKLKKNSFFEKEEVRIIGYIKGYSDTMGFNSGTVYNDNILTGEDYPTTIQVYPDGRFEVSYEAFHPHVKSLVFNNSYFEYYIEPGEILGVVLNIKDLQEKSKSSSGVDVSFLGNLRQINNEIASFKSDMPDVDVFSEDLVKFSPDEFSQKMLPIWDADLKRFGGAPYSKLSTAAVKMIKNKIDLSYATRLFDFILHRSYMAEQDTSNKKLKIKETESYYSFINRINLDDTTLMAQHNYSVFINRVEFSPLFPFIKYQSKENYEQLILDDFSKIYKKEKAPFSFKVASFRRQSTKLKRLNNKEALLKEFEGFKLKNNDDLFKDEFEELYARKLKRIEGYALPNSLAADSFRKIINNHKGKYLVIDFWAQWCGPCRIGIENSVAERKDLMNHPNLDFIFITDESGTPDKSFFDSYNQQNLMGNSYRVSADDYRAFRELFKFNGIPRYVLIDNEGKVMDDDFKRDHLKKELSSRFPSKFKDIESYTNNKGGQ